MTNNQTSVYAETPTGKLERAAKESGYTHALIDVGTYILQHPSNDPHVILVGLMKHIETLRVRNGN